MGNGTASDEPADGPETTVPAGAPLAHERDGGPAISGRVRDETGAALPGVTVTVARLSGEQVGRATTDGDGDYRVAVEGPGRYLVVAASGSLPPHAATVGIGTGSARHDARLAGGNGVRGAVCDAAGHGVDGLTVFLIDAGGDVAASGRSGEAGRFALTGVPEGRYTLTAVGEGVDPVAVGVEVPAVGAAAQDLRLPQRARLTGRVTAAPDGLPVNRALATLIDADGAVVGSRLSGPDGTFTFDRLPAGSYTLATSGYPPVATVVGLEPGRVTHSDVEFRTRSTSRAASPARPPTAPGKPSGRATAGSGSTWNGPVSRGVPGRSRDRARPGPRGTLLPIEGDNAQIDTRVRPDMHASALGRAIPRRSTGAADLRCTLPPCRGRQRADRHARRT